MFNFFKKKDKNTAQQHEPQPSVVYNSDLKNEYDSLKEKYISSPSDIEKQANAYISDDEYANPMKWMEALAICDAALERGEVTDNIKKLYFQMYGNRWNKHASMQLNEADYDFWFRTNADINNRFIQIKHYRAYAEQADLYSSARRPYRDYSIVKESFLKGVEAKDPASMGDYGYGLYLGFENYCDKADKVEGLRLINEAKELGYEIADLLLLYIDFNDMEDREALLAKIIAYNESGKKHKAYYLLADYYLRQNELPQAIEAMKNGISHNEHYCKYLYGMYILRGQIENEDKAKGIQYLEEAYDYYVINAANFLGQYYYYANDEYSSIEKSFEWHEKGHLYYASDSTFELAVACMYNDKCKDPEKGSKYLDIAVEEGYHKALSEKAYMLIDNQNPEMIDVPKAKLMFEQAMEKGNDYAPYRLGLGYERGEFGETPDYAKALELYELSAERGNTYGMDMAGHYYRLNFVSEDEGNAAKAVDYFNKAIERGSDYSRIELALCYEVGYGVEKDFKTAFDLYEAAAANGYPFAFLKMGYYHEDGLTGKEDLTLALECFQKASEAGMAEATYNLGRYYKYSVGVPENPTLALEYFEKAAEEGNAQALVEMGLAYEQEYAGLSFDAQKAMDYMTRSAELGYPYAQYKTGYYHYYGLIETNMEKGLEWFHKAYNQGYPFAAIILGEYHLYNHGGEGEYDKAFDYFKFAEERDCITEGLGLCYEYGLGVEENATEAFKYYTLAAEKDNTAAKYRLGLAYKYGTGTTENQEEAYNWLAQAVEEEHYSAQYELAMMLLDGIGTAKDEAKAIELLLKVAEDGHGNAQFELGNCYLTGKGVEEDETSAMVWYQKAADNGHEQAQKITGKRERRKR